jgi:hypothetical protein
MATKTPTINFAELPSIIIDPSLYEPQLPRPHTLLETVCETFIGVTRVLVVITFSGTAAFSGAHVWMGHQFPLERAAARGVQPAEPAVAVPSSRAVPTKRVVAMDLQLAAPGAGATCGPRTVSAPGTCVPSDAAPHAVAHARASRPLLDVALGVRTARRMLALNRLDEAEAAYRKVLVVDEHQPAALTGLARIHLARGALDDALVLAQRAVELAPDQASGQLALGDALRAKGVRPAQEAQADAAPQAVAEQAAPGVDNGEPQSL